MRLKIEIRDLDAPEWWRFWKIAGDGDVHKRFGFEICVLDLKSDAERVRDACIEHMRYVKGILRMEEMAMKRRSQMVRESKSSRAMEFAQRDGARRLDGDVRFRDWVERMF